MFAVDNVRVTSHCTFAVAVTPPERSGAEIVVVTAPTAVFVYPAPLVVTVTSFAEITASSMSLSIVITLILSKSITGDTCEFEVDIEQLTENIPFVLEVICLVFARVMF